MQYYIYKITNLVNNKPYVGKTGKTIEKRWKEHYYEARRWQKCAETGTNFGYNSRLYPAMTKYGYENFNIQLLEETASVEEMNQREQYWIDFYDARNNGYNIAAGGHGGFFSGCKHTPEAIEKIRKAGTGRKMPPEAVAKTAAAKLGRKASPEKREKMRQAKLGKKLGKHSAEWNKRISEGQINEVICVETGVIYRNIAEAARQTGSHASGIANCVTGRAKTTNGYHWQYKDKNKISKNTK
jgi:group I intron endonuclease